MSSCPVVLDPALLTFSRSLGREEFVARVRFLAEWAGLARSGEVQIHIAAEVRNFLIRNGYFPAHEAVADAIECLDLRFRYAPEDVIGPINTILNRASATAYCCIRDENHDGFVSTPPQPWYPDSPINEQVQRAVVLSSIETELHGRRQFIFASCLTGGRLEFSARVDMVDPDSIAGFRVADLPKTIQGTAVIAGGLEGVLDSYSAGQLWAAAACNVEIKTAIQVRCREKLKAAGVYGSMTDVPEFLVGSDFYASLVRCQAAGSGKFAGVTLEGCACAAMELVTLEWKAFNKSRRKADGAEPLRAHLTKAGVALRLMAWRRPAAAGGGLEFANVGEKWEEEISYSDPTEAV